MLVRIEVTAYNGKPLRESLTAEFDELGGSIGRGEGNTLVLPDPDRYISRTHAAILFRAGGYVIQDKGSTTPVQVNGRALGQGRESAIADGDQIALGGYTLTVQTLRNRAAGATSAPPADRPSREDPLALFGASSTADPFADPASPQPHPGKASASAQQALLDDPFAAPARQGRSGQGGAIPADFDPFADPLAAFDTPPVSPSGEGMLPDDFDLGLGSSTSGRKIDDLFGLSASSGDPFAPGNPLADPLPAGGFGGGADPLAAFGNAAPAGHAPAQRDDVPELHGSFRPPRPMSDPAPPPAAPRAPRPVTEQDMVLSWDEDGSSSGEIKTIIINPQRPRSEAWPTHEPPAIQPPPRLASPPEDVSFRSASLPAAPVPEASADSSLLIGRSQSVAPGGSHPVGVNADLLHAFLQGAGLPELRMPGGLTPQTMQMLGQVLREALQGTLDLLLARALLKREVRADVTMIAARENNPLKFSPNVEAALTHLLAPQTSGFMPPLRSMKDAYNDLRSHQFAFMAGMRAALDGVLKRFDPAELQVRLASKSVLDTLLPMNRKARLWDLFEELYGDISKEAEDDFHALFGREFLRAYEAQIEKLEQEAKDGGR